MSRALFVIVGITPCVCVCVRSWLSFTRRRIHTTQRIGTAETRAKVCGQTFILLTTGEGVGRSTLSLSVQFWSVVFHFCAYNFQSLLCSSPRGFHKFRINREQVKYTKSSSQKERREAEMSCLVSSIVSAAVQLNLLSALNIAANCGVF